MINLKGTLICTSMNEVDIIKKHLPLHIELTKKEEGCLFFEVLQTEEPLVWTVKEIFRNQKAYDLHQTRTKNSDWYQLTKHIKRSYKITDS